MAAKPIPSATPGQISAWKLKDRRVMPASCTNHTCQGHFTGAAADDCGRAKGGVHFIGGFGGGFYEISFARGSD